MSSILRHAWLVGKCANDPARRLVKTSAPSLGTRGLLTQCLLIEENRDGSWALSAAEVQSRYLLADRMACSEDARHRARRRDHDSDRRPLRFTFCVGPARCDWRFCARPRTNERVQSRLLLLLPRSGAD